MFESSLLARKGMVMTSQQAITEATRRSQEGVVAFGEAGAGEAG